MTMIATVTIVIMTVIVIMNSIIELKKYAKENHVPIILDEGLDFLLETIKKYNVKDVLEIGTAIGYSAINMALLGTAVTSIERDPKMYEQAILNVKDFNLADKIEIIFNDALTPNLVSKEYDLLFIDAAKGQYEKFFNLYTPYLRKGGIVVCDNMNFHELTKVEDLTTLSRGVRGLVKKLNSFKTFLKNNDDYKTTFYEIGDGMTLSIKL